MRIQGNVIMIHKAEILQLLMALPQLTCCLVPAKTRYQSQENTCEIRGNEVLPFPSANHHFTIAPFSSITAVSEVQWTSLGSTLSSSLSLGGELAFLSRRSHSKFLFIIVPNEMGT
jgi:hypothetical protein